jgi:hypothetical protein
MIVKYVFVLLIMTLCNGVIFGMDPKKGFPAKTAPKRKLEKNEDPENDKLAFEKNQKKKLFLLATKMESDLRNPLDQKSDQEQNH